MLFFPFSFSNNSKRFYKQDLFFGGVVVFTFKWDWKETPCCGFFLKEIVGEGVVGGLRKGKEES